MTSIGETATTRRAALLKDYAKDQSLIGTIRKSKNIAEFLKRHQVLIREDLAIVGLSKVDCIMLRLPHDCKPSAEMAAKIRKLRSLGVFVVLCAAGTQEEAEAAAKQGGFTGDDQFYQCISPEQANWSSLCSALGDRGRLLESDEADQGQVAGLVVLAQTPVERIPDAIRACQDHGKFVLYFGSADEEKLAVATAAVGFAEAESTDEVKSAASAIALGDDIAIIVNAIEVSRSMMRPNCCTVQ